MTTTTDNKLREAIDQAIEPLVNDHNTYLAKSSDQGLAVSRADLHYVFNQYHGQLLDFSADVMPVGHGHPFVHNAVREHLDYYMRTAPVGDHILRWPVEYAHDIVATFSEEDEDDTPLDHQVLFTEGEREALITAINIAKASTPGRPTIALVNTGVHDWYSETNQISLSLVPTEDFFVSSYRWSKCAALVISLVTEDGRVLEPRWVQEIVDHAKRNDVPVIVDESRTGFGRFGTMWGQQHHSFDADLTVLGGPVGGGMALGAVVATKKWFQPWEGTVSPQAGSPVACCAGAGTLRAINSGVLSHVKQAGTAMDESLHEVIEQFPEYVVATHGAGLWRVIEFQSDGQAQHFATACQGHGLLVAPPVGSSLILTPPLIASEMELKRGVDLIADTLLDWYEKDSAYS